MDDIAARSELMKNIAVVLVEPKYPENIGAAARCAMNFGIKQLVVVHNEEPDRDRMLKMATHNAEHIVDAMQVYANLDDALAPFSYVVGTTARQGRKRFVENTPRRVGGTVLPLLGNNQIAVMFGPEHRGLTNDDLKYCQSTITIPTADLSSLNLAQAVGVVCYELYYQVVQAPKDRGFSPKLASAEELEGMYEHVEQMLLKAGFLKTADYSYWMRNIRKFLGRYQLRAKEARIIRGFCRQFLWCRGQQQVNEEDSQTIHDGID